MKRGWNYIIFGMGLLLLCGLLMRGVTIIEPVLEESGKPLVIDGKIITQKNSIKTVMANWDAWLSMIAGITFIGIGFWRLNQGLKSKNSLMPVDPEVSIDEKPPSEGRSS
ncbi:MAG: hypothetical protein LAT55_13470 [Opitutales bacterium]|nr:hypothetical protein [Opitutales bacterium]